MHPFDLREKRFRLEKSLAALDEDEAGRESIEEQLAALVEICAHGNFDEDPDKGWRCRDCGLTRDPEPTEEPESAAAEPAAERPAATAG